MNAPGIGVRAPRSSTTTHLPDMPRLHRALDRALRLPHAVLIVLCLLLWLPGFFSLPPGDRDESRFAQATKQMIETGDALHIRNGTVARNQKPIGIYWLQLPFAAAARNLGLASINPIWPYRLPSLLGGIVAVLATFSVGRRLLNDRAALLGAVFLAASVILTTEVHIAKTDAALLATITVAMGMLARAWANPARVSFAEALAFWVALGLGILIKGPIAPMVVGLSTAWIAIIQARRGPPRWLRALRPKWGLCVLLAIVLPWFIAIGVATHGQFFAQSVGGDMAGKLAGSDDAHGGPPGLHLLLLPLLLFAGGIAALCAIPSVWRDRREPAVAFLTAWIVPSWLVFEIVATKLPHYTLPLYPAVSLLAARWMLSPPDPKRRWFAASVALGVVALLGLAALILPEVARPGLHTVDALGIPAGAIAALMLWLLRRIWPDARRAVLILLCGAPFLYASLFGLELPLLQPLWIAPRVAAILQAHWHARPADAEFGALGFAEPSLMFLCGTQTSLLAGPEAAAQFLATPDRVLAVGDRDLAAFATTSLLRGPMPTLLGSVSGYNYSRGRRITLSLFASADQSMK